MAPHCQPCLDVTQLEHDIPNLLQVQKVTKQCLVCAQEHVVCISVLKLPGPQWILIYRWLTNIDCITIISCSILFTACPLQSLPLRRNHCGWAPGRAARPSPKACGWIFKRKCCLSSTWHVPAGYCTERCLKQSTGNVASLLSCRPNKHFEVL